ncbi:MAG: type II toxin-antitoxin system ParD family antitoxin [Pseudomonadota bacterium]
MATMNISLPQQMKDWVEAQAKEGKYANSSDYVRDLIRRDEELAERKAAMEAKVRDAHESGFSDKTIKQVFADVRERASR